MLNSGPLNSAPLNGGAAGAGTDWELYAPVERQAIYVLDVGALRVPISSVQATMRLDGQSFLQATIPAGSQWVDALEDVRGEPMQLRKGFRYADGTLSRLEVIAQAPFQQLRDDQGPYSHSLTISGYGPYTMTRIEQRPLRGVSYRSTTAGRRRVRASIDLFLQPGHSAVDTDGYTLDVATIQYFIGAATEFMEVLEDG